VQDGDLIFVFIFNLRQQTASYPVSLNDLGFVCPDVGRKEGGWKGGREREISEGVIREKGLESQIFPLD
jgi:hypothetical protein